MKILTTTGRLTRDCEVKDNFVRFSLAADGFENGEKKTEFFDVTLFGKRGQSAAQYLTKGATVSVSGDFSTFTTDQGRTYCKVKTNDVTLCGGPRRDDTAPARQERQERPVSMSSAMEDDIPFMMEWR